MKITNSHVFFYGGILSNWAIINEGITIWIGDTEYSFPTSEHVFMALKAYVFGDIDSLQAIVESVTPRKAKQIGRQVKGFSDAIWNEKREECMMSALKAKFRCSSRFRNELLNKKYIEKIFVEASPVDCIWGIGLSENTPYIDNETSWRGRNLLGKLLTQLRDEKK